MKLNKLIRGIGWIIIALFVFIGITSSLGQIPPGRNPYNGGFAAYPVTTLMHVVPGIIFMVLGPLQFIGKIREKFINFHRWSGRIFMINCLFIGFSGLVMVVLFPYAGLNEQISVFFFGPLFLFSLYKAYSHIRRYEIEQHREWMIRVFSIGLGISMIRILILIMVVFMGYRQIDIFAWTFWGGFGGTWLVGELWILATKARSLR